MLQGVYRTFVRNAKFVSAASMPHIHFLGACVIEMFGLDVPAAYEHAFAHIRELAALLRSSMAMKTKDAYREVYCWQTTCTLELWGKLLGAHADKPVRLRCSCCMAADTKDWLQFEACTLVQKLHAGTAILFK